MGLAALLGIGGGYFLNLDLPDVRSLEDYRPATISRLLAADRSLIAQFATERRTVIPYASIPPVLRNAILAVEDANFFEHLGVDPLGIFRAAGKDILAMRKAQGASTLTMQLTRGLFLKPDKTWRRKIREAILAMQIEKAYTKEEIFAFYCNQAYLGHGYYGVEAASQFYFSRPAKDLSLSQAALLAGLIQRPEALSPLRNPKAALRRRNHVLKRMMEERYIDRAAYEAATEEPLGVVPQKPAGAFADYFVEEVRRDLDARFGQEALYRSGMTIETGLDPNLQRVAEAALQRGVRALAKRRGFRLPAANVLKQKKGSLEEYRHPGWGRPIEAGGIVTGLVLDVDARRATVRVDARTFDVGPEALEWTGRGAPDRALRPGDLAPFLVVEREGGVLGLELSAEPTCDGAVLAIDPATGAVRALVGGIDYGRSQWDRAIQATRQPGSAFKPIIYTAALEEGWRATDLLLDEPTVFVDPQTAVPYQPENYYRDYNGIVTVRRAIEQSLNVATIRMLNQIGYQRAAEQARRMGISTPIRPYPAMGLGASEVSLIDLVAAYAVFPNLGTLVKPRLHARILSYDGEVIETVPASGTDAVRPEVAYLMTSLMRGVIARGTAKEAAFLGEEIAGKTGTTDDNTDAWFIGYSPSLVLGVWVGKDDKAPLGYNETGAVAALPIWIEIMKEYLKDRPAESFRRPQGIETVAIDSATGLQAGVDTGCEEVILEDFLRGQGPPSPCSRLAHARAALPYYLQRYPWLDEERIALTQEDLARVLREAPLEVATEGGHALTVVTDRGVRRVAFRIVSGDDPALASVAGAQALRGSPSAPEGGRPSESLLGLAYPFDLSPIVGDPASHPTVGLDGRAAAVIMIRYP